MNRIDHENPPAVEPGTIGPSVVVVVLVGAALGVIGVVSLIASMT